MTCFAHILLDVWPSLEQDPPTRGQILKENSLLQQLSIAP